MYKVVGVYIETICLYYNNSVMQFADETLHILMATLDVLTDLRSRNLTGNDLWHDTIKTHLSIIYNMPEEDAMRTTLFDVWKNNTITVIARIKQCVDILMSIAADEAEIRNREAELRTREDELVARNIQADEMAAMVWDFEAALERVHQHNRNL